MDITCPNCQFSRTVPDDKVPPSSVNATCPKCGVKFKFRDIDPPQSVSSDFTLTSEPPAPTTPPAASEPTLPPVHEPVQAPPEQPEQPAQQAADNLQQPEVRQQGPDNDIWQRLGDLGDAHGQGPQQQDPRFSPSSEDIQTAEVPFEDLDTYGFFGGLWQTIKRVMLSPRLFFSAMPLGRGIGRPLIFYLLLGEISFLFSTIWQTAGMDLIQNMVESSGAEAGLMASGGMSFVGLIVMPVFLVMGLFVTTALTHLMLLIFRGANAGFEGTLRANAYSSSPSILAVFPLLGTIVGSLWYMVVFPIALKEIHKTSYTRVIVALSLPLLLIMIVGFAVGVMNAPEMMETF